MEMRGWKNEKQNFGVKIQKMKNVDKLYHFTQVFFKNNEQQEQLKLRYPIKVL